MSEWNGFRDPKLSHRTYRMTLVAPVEARYGTATGGEVFYDPSQRLWTGYLINAQGYQMSPADYGVTREEAQGYVEGMAR